MEFFEVVLVSATNAGTAEAPMDASSVIFIRDDDAPPAFEFVPNVPAHRPRPATYDGTDAGGMYPRETIGYAARVASSNDVNATTYFDAAAKEEEEATRKRSLRRDAASDSSVEAIIRRVSGVASAPSVLHYETVTVAEDGSYARVGGEMVWDTSGEDAASASERRVFIPVDWSVVPDHAEIAVGLRLTAVANARAPVNEPAEAAAVWIYGVERGSCARGFRRDEPAPRGTRNCQRWTSEVKAKATTTTTTTTETETNAAGPSTSSPRSIPRADPTPSRRGPSRRLSSTRRCSTPARRWRFRRRVRARRRRRASGRRRRRASSSSGSRETEKRRA